MSGAVSQSLGWALLHLLWQGALVAAVLAVALQLVGRRAASTRYLLACGALALMLVLPALTGWRHYASLRAEPLAKAPPLIAANEAAPTPALVLPKANHPVAASARAPESTPVLERAQALLEGHLHWLVLAWGLGVAVSSLRLLSGWLRLRRLVREAEPAPAEWQEALEKLARRLGMTRPVRLLRSAALDVPAAVGWLRPVVLLPVSALTGLPTRQLEMVLAHELAHIRRYDFAVNLVQTLVETLLFYHPAVWWMSRVIRVEREHCCDDIAVGTSGNPVSYARALTALEALRVLPLGESSPAMSALGGSLTERVRRLVGAPAARCSSRFVAGASIITLVSSMAVAAPLAALVLPEPPEAPLEAPMPPEPLSAPGPLLAQAPAPVPVPVPMPSLSGKDKDKGDKDKGDKDKRKDNHDEDDDDTLVDGRQLSVDQLVALKTTDVTPERVKELESLGYAPTVGNLVGFGHAGVTPEYVKEMTSALGRKPTAEELVQMKHLGVSTAQVQSLKAAGYGNLSAEDLTQAAAVGVDERFIGEMRSAGYDKLSMEDLVQLRALGVDSDFIRKMRDEGLDKLSVDELVRLRASGVDSDFIRQLRKQK